MKYVCCVISFFVVFIFFIDSSYGADQPENLGMAVKEIRRMISSGYSRTEVAERVTAIVDEQIVNNNSPERMTNVENFLSIFGESEKDKVFFEWRNRGGANKQYDEMAEWAWNNKTGQCGENSALTYYILKHAGAEDVRLFASPGHAYAVWGLDPEDDPRERSNWTNDVIIPDSWLGKTLHGKEGFNNKYCSGGKDVTHERDSSEEPRCGIIHRAAGAVKVPACSTPPTCRGNRLAIDIDGVCYSCGHGGERCCGENYCLGSSECVDSLCLSLTDSGENKEKKTNETAADDKVQSDKKTPDAENKGYLIVPAVEEKPAGEAIDIVKLAGFTNVIPVGGNPAPLAGLSGHIKEQTPEGGTSQSPETPVTLTIYSAAKIPDVTELAALEAKEKLKKAGFAMKPEGIGPPPTKDLSLLAKSQRLGEKTNEVIVSFYSPFVELTVPSIVGASLKKAQDVLDELGLRLSSDLAWGEQAVSREEVGKIYSQNPAKGEPIEPGGEVKASIYYTVVPRVLTKSLGDAKTILADAWLSSPWENGQAVENKRMWNTIQSQSLPEGKKISKAGTNVSLKVYIQPEQKKNSYHDLVGYWEGFNYKNGSKIKVVVHFEILSVDTNGVMQGTIITPKQVVQLHNNSVKKNTMSVSRVEMPFQGIAKGKNITFSYKIVGGKGKSQGVWDTKNMTITGKNSLSSKLLKGGKWHENGVQFSVRKNTE